MWKGVAKSLCTSRDVHKLRARSHIRAKIMDVDNAYASTAPAAVAIHIKLRFIFCARLSNASDIT